MHELSIANNLIEVVTQHVDQLESSKVLSVTIRIGALSCVNKGALDFSFDLIAEDTCLSGAKISYVDVPVSIYCKPCDQEVELPGIQHFCCPVCQTPSPDIRKGRELDVENIEVV